MKERKYTLLAIKKDMRQHWSLYAMAIPLVVFLVVFAYLPMGGLLMAFEDYRPNKGIFGSDFVGFQNFFEFFQSPFAPRVIRNTLVISFLQLAIEFPLVIVFALLMNEIRVGPFRKTVQMLTYMPYFISIVVMAGIIVDPGGIPGRPDHSGGRPPGQDPPVRVRRHFGGAAGPPLRSGSPVRKPIT